MVASHCALLEKWAKCLSGHVPMLQNGKEKKKGKLDFCRRILSFLKVRAQNGLVSRA